MPSVNQTEAIAKLESDIRAAPSNSPTKALYQGKGYRHLVGEISTRKVDGVEHYEAQFSNEATEAGKIARGFKGAAGVAGGVLTLGGLLASKDFRRRTISVAKNGRALQTILWPVKSQPTTPEEKAENERRLGYDPKSSQDIERFVGQDHIRRQIREYLGMEYYIDWKDGSALIRDTDGKWRSWGIFDRDGSNLSRGEMVKAIRVFIAQYDDMVKAAKEKEIKIDANFVLIIRSKEKTTIICNNHNLINDPNYRETLFTLYQLGQKVKWSKQAKKNVDEIFKVKEEDPKPFESPLSSSSNSSESDSEEHPRAAAAAASSSRVEELDDDNLDG